MSAIRIEFRDHETDELRWFCRAVQVPRLDEYVQFPSKNICVVTEVTWVYQQVASEEHYVVASVRKQDT